MATIGDHFDEVVFDPYSMILMVVSVKDGIVTSMVDVELQSVVATESKFAEMVTLKSSQSARGDGYVGTISAALWADIQEKARKLRIVNETLKTGKAAKDRGNAAAEVLTLSPWARRRKILNDSSFSVSQVRGDAALDLSDTMTIFNMTSLPGPAEDDQGHDINSDMNSSLKPPQTASNISAPLPVGLKPPTTAAKPIPSVFVPAYATSLALRALLIESREAMQIYFRVKLQPFFRSVECVATIAEALEMLALVPKNHFSVAFLHCIDLLNDDTPFESLKRLGLGEVETNDTTAPTITTATLLSRSIKVAKNPAKLLAVYGIPNYAETGEEMLAFIDTLCACGVTDLLDEPFTYDQVQQLISKVVFPKQWLNAKP
jgi:hypothetical protein